MNYRTVYNDTEVLTSIVNDDVTVTSSLEKFIIDTIDNTINRLESVGVDVSYFWKNGLASRFTPVDNEIAISDHPLDSSIKRKVFFKSMPVFQNDQYFLLNIIVRHFDSEDNHITDPYDDKLVSLRADNTVFINGVGEYDYFKSLQDAGASIFTLQEAQVPIMDSLERFNNY